MTAQRMNEVRTLPSPRKRLGFSLPRLLLVLILLGPPTLREGREASATFASPLDGLDWTYILHLAVWVFAGVYVFSRLLRSPDLLLRLLRLVLRFPSSSYICFVVVATLSAMWSVFPFYTLFYACKMWIAIFLILYVAHEAKIRHLSPSEILLHTVGWAYGLGLGLLTVFFFVNPDLVTRPTSGILGFRLTGGFLSDYGAYGLVTSAFIITMYWHRTRDPLFKLVGVIAFVWALIALILAQTRSTLMAFVLFLPVFFLFGVRGLTKVMWATGLAILGFLGATLAGQAILAFLQRGQDLEGFFTLSGRTYLLSFLMDHWRDSPLLGWGFQAGSRYFAVQFMEQTGMNMGAAHDAISKILVDLGLLGGVVLLHAVGSLLLALGWLYRRLPRDQWLFLLSLGLYGLANSAFGAGVADSAPIWVVLFLTPSLALSFCHPLKGTPRGD